MSAHPCEMNVEGIVQLGDPILSTKCLSITTFDTKFKSIVADIVAATEQSGRAGVAAPQLGYRLQVFAVVMYGTVKVFVNPKITSWDGSSTEREGCLSVADHWFDIPRAEYVTIRAQDEHGNWFDGEATGLIARAFQHECDHLAGILITDRAREHAATLSRQPRRTLQRKLDAIGA